MFLTTHFIKVSCPTLFKHLYLWSEIHRNRFQARLVVSVEQWKKISLWFQRWNRLARVRALCIIRRFKASIFLFKIFLSSFHITRREVSGIFHSTFQRRSRDFLSYKCQAADDRMLWKQLALMHLKFIMRALYVVGMNGINETVMTRSYHPEVFFSSTL